MTPRARQHTAFIIPAITPRFDTQGTAVVVRLLEKRGALSDVRIKGVLGFVYDGYRDNMHVWESVVMLRKLFVAGTVVFFSQDAYLQALFASFICLVSLVFQLIFEPFESRLHNVVRLYCMSNGCECTTR